MKDMNRSPDVAAEPDVSPNDVLSEVANFRDTLANPTLSPLEKRRAYGQIVRHAAMQDPLQIGFERVGVALKEALCLWLDFRPSPSRQ